MSNIALIVGTMECGGAERCVADLSLLFSKRGHQVYLVTNTSIPTIYEYSGTLVNLDNSLPYYLQIQKLKTIKRLHKIDISVSFMQAANLINILSKTEEKIILTTHGVNSIYASEYSDIAWRKDILEELYQYADAITFPSNYCHKDWIDTFGDTYGITKTVYNPVHLMEKSNHNTEKENVIISVGRMHEVKRPWHILNSFALVAKEKKDAKLIMLGDGPMRPRLMQLAEELGIKDKVDMPGNVDNVSDYLAKAKVCVFTSKCEAMSCVVLEAVSAGVPVVSFDIPGGMREELGIDSDESGYPIDGRCGIITSYPNDTSMCSAVKEDEELAEQIIRVLDDVQLTDTFKNGAIEHIKGFMPETIATEWCNDLLTSKNNKTDSKEFESLRNKIIDELEEVFVKKADMYYEYYYLLDKWMTKKESGLCCKEWFYSNGINSIVIYGYGKMAHHLLEELKGTDIEIKAIIDRNKTDNDKYLILAPTEEIPKADVIIVTPTYDFETIKVTLSGKTDIPVISLKDLIYG